jgi:Alginate export
VIARESRQTSAPKYARRGAGRFTGRTSVGAAALWWVLFEPGLAGPAATPNANSGAVGPPPVAPQDSILAEYTPQAPPNPSPPPYTLLRFNEDYSYLADPARRTDPFDAVKYISLSADDPLSYLSLGGDLRERYENFTYAGFGVSPNPSRSHDLLQRIDIDADWHFNEHFRLFTQVISGYDWGSNTPAPPVDQDPAALQQAFLDFRTDDTSAANPEYLVVRAGRFAMTYGSGRLIATRQAPNIPFKFDGLELIGAAHDAKIYAFLTNPAREQKTAFDDDFPHQLFGGVYATTPLLSSALGLRADLYYLYYQNDSVQYANGTGPEVRNTFGTRLFGKMNGFDYDIEPIIQTGNFAGREIFAWTVGSTVGYRFEQSPLKPRLGADFDVVSGDSGKGHFGTFNPLFFKSGYFDDASLIRPSNIIDIHPTLQLQAPHALLVTLGSDLIWRYTRRDGIYGPPGNLELPAGGQGRYLATTAEASVQWQLSRHLSWIGSYTRFFTGNYVQSARGHDVDFFGTWATFTF